MKQFDDAIKATKEGEFYDYNKLPMPPGFAKIPLTADGKAILGGSSSSTTTTNRASTQPVNRSSQLPVGSSSRIPFIRPPVVAPILAKQPAKKPANKDLAIILERQRLFKEAALNAKKEGNTNVALVYLRHAKVLAEFFHFYLILDLNKYYKYQ